MRAILIPIAEKPDFAITLAHLAVNTYSLIVKSNINIREIVFAPLKWVAISIVFLARVIIAIFESLSLIFLIPALILTLAFGNLIFLVNRASQYESFKKMDRKFLINKHLKIERALLSIQQMRKSRFLFDTPILGTLNKSFEKNVVEFEAQLKVIAYPNLYDIPSDIPIHKFDKSDVWQDDLHLYSEGEIIRFN